ncbi:unnamed protein product [Choristocarpus tenellus]
MAGIGAAGGDCEGRRDGDVLRDDNKVFFITDEAQGAGSFSQRRCFGSIRRKGGVSIVEQVVEKQMEGEQQTKGEHPLERSMLGARGSAASWSPPPVSMKMPRAAGGGDKRKLKSPEEVALEEFAEVERRLSDGVSAASPAGGEGIAVRHKSLSVRKDRPQEPEAADCCGNGCQNCVWITYWEELQVWQDAQ